MNELNNYQQSVIIGLTFLILASGWAINKLDKIADALNRIAKAEEDRAYIERHK